MQIDEARTLLYRVVNQREYEIVHGRNNRGEGKILLMRTGNRPALGAWRVRLCRVHKLWCAQTVAVVEPGYV